jgi:hypothetical protein
MVNECISPQVFKSELFRSFWAKTVFERNSPMGRAVRFHNREMPRAGAVLCVIVHRSLIDAGDWDLAWQAIEAGMPT